MDTPKEITSSVPSEKNIALITEVKKFPSLYDNSDPNYYVLAERNKAWLQVSKNCGDPADLCHLRWKALRKRFAKEKRRFHEILQGRRRPWALFPKMSFITPSHIVPKVKRKPKRESRTKPTSVETKKHSYDDLLIIGENNEIVHTIKSGDMSEDDEYIYETLDDPDSALEIMRNRPTGTPSVKPTAIRSGGALRPPVVASSRAGGSGRIRKLTPKMQNSMIAKKLKQAQQILQKPTSTSGSKKSSALEQRLTNIAKTQVNSLEKDKHILNEDKTTRHIATVNPNFVRIGKGNEENITSAIKSSCKTLTNGKDAESTRKQPFKVVKLKGRNPLIFSPDQYPEIHSFLQSESSRAKEEANDSPVIKVKSVDNLNNTNGSSTSQTKGDNSNLDIIHSVGLMRKTPVEKPSRVENMLHHHSYSRSYSWNRPDAKAMKQSSAEITNPPPPPNLQVHNFETEETWNDIKEEIIDDGYWTQPQEQGYLPHEPMVMMHTPDELQTSAPSPSVTQAKLELIAFQKRLMEEQHQRTLEYMKKEHDMKMAVLRAEIDLKRKQLNIML